MTQSSSLTFGRLIPAMVTPFDQDKNVDFKRAVELGHRLLEGGSDCLMIAATTGESPNISTEDKVRLFELMKNECGGEAPIVANVGSYNTEASIDLAKRAEQVGVDGLMTVVPYYNKPPQEGMYQHFKAIAESVDLPIILYNIPGRCGVNMLAETTLRLARDCKNIIGVKEASGDLDQIKQIIDGAPEGFVVYSGDDALTYDVMKLGGVGVISTTANVLPARMKEIVELCAAGDWDSAWAAHEALLPIMKQLFATSNPILVKQALASLGFPVGGVKLPLVDATAEQTRELEEVLRKVGALQ
ncbi:MAG: 4-hydroxy-tetrahydrodipicolinate synthase [Coriobacteriaceae bacterium]|nr:4-hydroxy-tetrahydrodipicolinate synthase [Coriobacteriaceae bacterium]MDD6636324.1 4-hydroxy-tetrahydrodipicolinate synthase [Coriobacteriaceae bacterium]MDY3799278.1 4-hydroxy-tetrahydrodipicolinate synthase [Eggerthellaceae bacterium]MDY4987005.1 4-hydroxy-tetrahydrodipicolinate synthase [Eggerthellaceae bacterium]MDY5371467.1 4-hydroxy-tetrahydrodipicolinate synthase [Eggerthellaceae bacterium]